MNILVKINNLIKNRIIILSFFPIKRIKIIAIITRNIYIIIYIIIKINKNRLFFEFYCKFIKIS